MAKRISKTRLIATAARDYNKGKRYDLWGKGTILLLPEKIDKEDDDKVIVRSDQTAEQRDVL